MIRCPTCSKAFASNERVERECCGNVIIVEPDKTIDRKPSRRPGLELQKLIPEFLSSEGCGCKAYARQMDRWGVEGCKERFDEIVEHLIEQSRKGVGRFAPEVLKRAVAERWVSVAVERAEASLIN